jgi:hypothetical protein
LLSGRWGSLLVQEKYQGEKACDKRQQQQQCNNNNNNVIFRYDGDSM